MPRRTRRTLLPVVLLGLAVALPAALTACGVSEDSTTVSEGQPVKLGELTYNVQLSRFLNPSDNEDRFYLTGKGQLPKDKEYFGVFVQVSNSADTSQPLPRDFVIEDTQGNKYTPVSSKSVFALDLGGSIEPHGSAPAPDSPARNGPTEGSLIIFVVKSDVTENRPLHLLIPGPAGKQAEVKLDI